MIHNLNTAYKYWNMGFCLCASLFILLKLCMPSISDDNKIQWVDLMMETNGSLGCYSNCTLTLFGLILFSSWFQISSSSSSAGRLITISMLVMKNNLFKKTYFLLYLAQQVNLSSLFPTQLTKGLCGRYSRFINSCWALFSRKPLERGLMISS